MKNIILTTILILNFCFAFAQVEPTEDWAKFSRYEKANKIDQKGATVFMGNSITAGWYKINPDFFSNNNYLCRGIGGQTTMQMLVRFRRDVIDLKPKAVVILAGINDIAKNMGYISLENTLGNIISMAELAKGNGIKVILCSVLPAYEFRWRKELKPADEVIALNKMIKAYADENKLPYVDYHAAMKDSRNGLPEKYAKDGVHPLKEGYNIMEAIVEPVIEKTLKGKK